LLVDEVLAVGDLEFQKKCLGKMQEVSESGRTIVLVSHQMNQIRRLCQRCIWIDGGQIRLSGSMLEVVSAYEASFSTFSSLLEDANRKPECSTRFLSWRIAEPINTDVHVLESFGSVAFEFFLNVDKEIHDGLYGVALFNSDHQIMWATSVNKLTMNSALHVLRLTLPSLPLRPGIYHWEVSIWDSGRCLDQWTCVPDLIVGTKPVTHPEEKWQGILNTPWEFRTEERNPSTMRDESSLTSKRDA